MAGLPKRHDYSKTPKIPRPTLALSKSFRVEVKKNKEICAQYASGPCGWGADGDEYLDAQEYEANLSYESSGMSIAEIGPNLFQVTLNVYPSVKDAGDYYQRTIIYKMVNENGAWVVDDVMYADGVSTRKKMAEENAFVIAHPDPDVSAKNKK